jgi:hypothetical protein
MSKPIIVRKSFNGGEIAPELHYRSDLEAYHNSCRALKNMNVTPWGAIERRPPLELVAKIDESTYGVPVKYVPFRFSLTEAFHVIFTDGTGSASPDDSTADLIIFDADGTLQTLSGASTKILSTVYDPADLGDLHHIQVNDFIYMTCGGNYPVQVINRFFDDAQSANRWKAEEWTLDLGPFEDVNTDPTHTLSVNVSAYDAGTTYAAGDVVTGEIETDSSLTVVAIHWIMKSETTAAALIECSTPHGLSGGDRVTLTGCSHSARWITNSLLSEPRLSDPITVNMNQTYSAVAIYSANVFEVNEWLVRDDFDDDQRDIGPASNLPNYTVLGRVDTYKDYINRTAAVSGSFSNSSVSTIEGTFVSLQDSNTGNALTNAAFWRVGGATEGVVVASADIVANKDTFVSSDVGRLVAIADKSDERLNGAYSSDQSSDPVNAYGTVTLKTEGGAWSGLLELQQSTDDLATWETIGSIRSENGESNGSIEREVTGPKTAIRVRLTGWAAPTGTYETEKCVWQLSFANEIFQIFKITAFTDAQNVTVSTVSPLLTSLSSAKWKLGSFSETTGYPYSLTIHDERLTLAGSKKRPNTIFASRTNQWGDFLLSDLDTSPFSFTIASDSFDSVRWIRSARQLMIGSDNSESTMGTRDSSQAITGTNVDVSTQTFYGSANIQAAVTADLIFFVQGQARRVRSMQYDFGTDQFLSSEMSIYAHHVTAPGIKEMSFVRDPYSLLFFTLTDGSACTFTYERDNKVRGWARFALGGSGEIISAGSNYTPEGDSVFCIVERNGEYLLEGLAKSAASTVYLDGQKQFVGEDYSDGVALPFDATGAVVVLDDVQLDPADYTISGGTLTVPGETSGTLTVGWPAEFEIEPSPPVEFGDFGAMLRPEKITLYLLSSGGCDVNMNGQAVNFTQGARLAATERLTGPQSFTCKGGRNDEINITLTGTHHKPFTLSGIGLDVHRSA